MMRRMAGPVSIWNLMEFLFCMLGLVLAGTAWVNIPHATPAPAPCCPDSGDATARAALEREISAARERLAAVTAERDRLRRALVSIQGEARSAADRSRVSAPDLARLEQDLAKRSAEVARLAEELAKTERAGLRGGMGAPVAGSTGKRPVFVELARNRVVPITDAHYRFESFRLNNGQTALVASRTAEGQAIEDLADPAGAFARLLQELKPDQQFLAAVVRADSFAAFRAIREIARGRNIEFGWEPYHGQDGKLVFGSGGRDVRVQP